MSLVSTLRFILSHPLNRTNKMDALGRFFRWQFGSRILRQPAIIDFVSGARLIVTQGMTGATGNIYTGLHEFEDMAFVLHALRKEDTFVDIGANVGSYTILAGKSVGAKCISVEPIPTTFSHLIDNIQLNKINDRVVALNIGLGKETGRLRFTAGLDCVNHVISETENESDSIEVPVKKLDEILTNAQPYLIKMDVEGFETEVVAGASETLSRKSLNIVIMELNGSGDRYGYDEVYLHKQILAHGFLSYQYQPLTRKLISLERERSRSGNTLYIKDAQELLRRIQLAAPFAMFGRLI